MATFSVFTAEHPLNLPWGEQISGLNAAGCKVWVDPDTKLGSVLLEFQDQHQRSTLLHDLDDLLDETVNPTSDEQHTSELQSLMRISYAVFCLKKKKHKQKQLTSMHELTAQTNL